MIPIFQILLDISEHSAVFKAKLTDLGGAQFAPEMRQVEAPQIAQLDAFELLPDALARMQLWGIRWQMLQMDAWRRPVHAEFLCSLVDYQTAQPFAPLLCKLAVSARVKLKATKPP
jgi:hypothetical protein